MKQKQILSLLGLTLLVLGVSAGTLLVQQNQNLSEKAVTSNCGVGLYCKMNVISCLSSMSGSGATMCANGTQKNCCCPSGKIIDPYDRCADPNAPTEPKDCAASDVGKCGSAANCPNNIKCSPWKGKYACIGSCNLTTNVCGQGNTLNKCGLDGGCSPGIKCSSNPNTGNWECKGDCSSVTSCSDALQGKCNEYGKCPDGQMCKEADWVTPSKYFCSTEHYCNAQSCKQKGITDEYQSSCSGNPFSGSQVQCISKEGFPVWCCKKGSYYDNDQGKCISGTRPTPIGGGGGQPPPGQKTPKPPPKKKGTPAPSCKGNKNPSTFTAGKSGKITIYYNVQGTGDTPLQVAVKPNTTTCSLTDNAGVFDLTDNTTGKMETNLEATSGQKVCFGIYYNSKAGAMWNEPGGNICGGGNYDELDISANITQAESESGAGSISSKQCWANSLTECDFNDFALVFAVGGGTDNTVGIKLRFQGITKKAWDQKIKANFSRSGSTIWEGIDINVSNDDTGVYTLPVDPSITSATYDLRIKGHSHLQKLFSNLVYNGTGADLSASQGYEIRAGDVTDDNAITIEDVAQVSTYYTDFSIPVVEGDAKMTASDINKDGIITIQDLALIAINWSDLTVEGDQ